MADAAATAALPDAHEEDHKPPVAADGVVTKQPAVFDPFPACADYVGGFVDGLGAANAAAFYGPFVGVGKQEGANEDAGFGAADYSSLLDVSENSSNSSSWNEVGSLLDVDEALHWAAAAVKEEPLLASAEHKFWLSSCQEQIFLANFDFNFCPE
jgi:hypothetical protein